MLLLIEKYIKWFLCYSSKKKTVPQSNRNIVETEAKSKIHIYDRSLSELSKGTSIKKSGRDKQVLCD